MAKKKKEKAKKDIKPAVYEYDESYDFSAPLNAYNLYRTQGSVNWGPMTGPGTKIDDRVSIQNVVRNIMKEISNVDSNSSWKSLLEYTK